MKFIKDQIIKNRILIVVEYKIVSAIIKAYTK